MWAHRANFANARGVLEKTDKGGNKSPVTDTDKEIETIIISSIRERFPDHLIVGEEHSLVQRSSDYVWYVDPIDGTINYIRGFPFSSISLALWHGTTPVVGVVFDPIGDTLYSSVNGEGAYKDMKERLSVSEVKTLVERIGNV